MGRPEVLARSAAASLDSNAIIGSCPIRISHFRDDVRLLGGLLGEVLKSQGGLPLFETVEHVRALAKELRASGQEDLAELSQVLAKLRLEDAVPVARAFAHFLTLANIAEQHHRTRRRRDYQHDAEPTPQPAPA